MKSYRFFEFQLPVNVMVGPVGMLDTDSNVASSVLVGLSSSMVKVPWPRLKPATVESKLTDVENVALL